MQIEQYCKRSLSFGGDQKGLRAFKKGYEIFFTTF